MNIKRIWKALLFPHNAILAILIPAAAIFLIASMLYLEAASPISICSYTLAFYTLVVVSARIPDLIHTIADFKNNNQYIQTWTGDIQLRTNITLSISVLWNIAYGALQLGLGIYHRSAWFYSLSAYYATLASMRLFLVRHTIHHKPGEHMRQELRRYRACGLVFLLINLALSCMIFYMIYENRAVHHNKITTITMATYTFTALTLAILNAVRYRKFNSPAVSAAKAISLAAACVSMLTLENTMLSTFSNDAMTPEKTRLFLSISGGAVSVFIIAMSVYMIIQANRRLRLLTERT